MAGTRKRRTWKAEDKLRIVLAGLDGSIEISELCRREGINPTQYYGWKKQLLSSAQRVFSDGKKKSATQERMAEELQRKNAVMFCLSWNWNFHLDALV